MLEVVSQSRYLFMLKSILKRSSACSSSESNILPFQIQQLRSYISSTKVLERRNVDQSDDGLLGDSDDPPRLFVVQPRIRPDTHLKAKLEEALNLANSLEQQRDGYYATEFSEKEKPPHLVVQNPMARSPRADTFFGAGTLETVKCYLNELETKNDVDAVYVNAILSGVQQRNLERAWKKPVLDRVGLIIEIFNAHAQTKEAKLQAELAALMYKRSRLVRVRGADGRYTFGGVAEAEVVSARGRGSGGRGFISGAGETELQLQRRRISDRRKKLLSEIQEVRRTRAVQRAARKRQSSLSGEEVATVAIVGYTNAGKSSLVSALSDNYLYCDDRLFATVDPKLSSVILPSGRKLLLSDTVGFISDLPVQLVEAFHATLEEVIEADLLVHVLDSSAKNIDEHRQTVLQVLAKIGVSDEKLSNMIEVWNKIDLEDESNMDEQDYISSFSEEEDADDNGVEIEASARSYTSDEWLLSEDEQELAWFDHSDGTIGSVDTMNQSQDPAGNSYSGSQQSTCHVKTSAITGVGLQELLELIDEKLQKSNHVVERSIYDKKWRPTRGEVT